MDRADMRYHAYRLAFFASLAFAPGSVPGLGAQTSQTAGSSDRTAQWSTGETYFRVGAASLGLDRLNAALLRNGRPTFSNNVATVGISTEARTGRLIYGASIEQGLPRRALENDWVTKLATGGASLDAGLAIIETSNSLIYSTVSLGMRSTSLHFERRGGFTYSEGLQDPARGLDLSSRTGLAVFGVTGERHFETHRAGMFTLAVQAGIARPLGAPNTFAGENHVEETPGQSSGRYIRLAFGKPLAARGSALETAVGALASMVLR
jgi:hypothetical protein